MDVSLGVAIVCFYVCFCIGVAGVPLALWLPLIMQFIMWLKRR